MAFRSLKKRFLTPQIMLALVLILAQVTALSLFAQELNDNPSHDLIDIVTLDESFADTGGRSADWVATVYDTAAAADSALAPAVCPAGPGAPLTSTVERTNFCVYYDPANVTLAQATTAADHVENIYWPTLTAELGEAPKFSGKLEIHLTNDASCNGGTGWSLNYFTTYRGCITPDILFQKVLGHELTHRVQYNHDDGPGAPHQTKTFKEGTARAIEDQFAAQDTWVGALGFSSYASQSMSAFATPNRDWWAYSWRYHFAPAWKYFSEQYPGASTTEPGYGWDYYEALFNCTTANVGKAAVNCAQSVMGGPSYYEMWKLFARALYTKDLDVGSLPGQEYYILDEQQAGDQPGPVAKNVGSTITATSNQTWNGESISYDGMDYYEVPLGSSCEVATVSFTSVTGNPYLYVIGRSGSTYKWDTGGVATGGSWSQSFLKTDETHVAAVVVGLSSSVAADIEMSCGDPVLDIKQPLQLAPDYVQPLDVIVTQVLVTNGSPTSPVIAGLSYLDFTAMVEGTPALILGGGYVEEQYFLMVQAPNLSNGPKDLTISLGGATDTEIEAVIYDLTNSDNVIVIDRSGSMGWYSPPPMDAAQDAANFFIDASNSSEGLGVVAYNHDLSPAPLGIQFGTLPHRNSAHAFVNGLTPSGGTSIGDGLDAPGPNGGAVDQINNSPTANVRCQIVLLSDGNENSSLFWTDVMADVVATGCPVMSIAFGPGADETLMQTIASSTGGLSFYNDVFVSVKGSNVPSAITPDDMFLDLGDTYLYVQEQGEDRDRILSEKGGPLISGQVHTHTAMVDATMSNLLVTLDWVPDPQSFSLWGLHLVDPNGTIHNTREFTDTVSGHTGIRVPSPATGQWQFVVTRLRGRQNNMYEIHASGESDLEVELILLDQLQMNQTTGQEVPIRALIPVTLNGRAPLLAGVTVVAEVIAPDGTATNVQLYDDGQHNDGKVDDGLWAGVYTLVNQAEAVDQVGEPGFPLPAPPRDQGAYRVMLHVMGPTFTREAMGSFAVLEGESTSGTGIPDIYLAQYGPANEDPDLDNLMTGDEYWAGTNPLHSDSDSADGILRESDWSEVNNAQDPLDSADDQILAPEHCTALGQDGVVVLEYDVKPVYDQMRAYRRMGNGPWNFHAIIPLNTGGVYSDTLNVTNGKTYEYQINAVDGTHTSAQVMCGFASPLTNWLPPSALLRVGDGISTIGRDVTLTFYAYEEEGILEFAEIHEMRISNTSDFTGVPWEPFQETGKMWQLAPSSLPGSIVTVYAEFRNMDGLTSAGPAVGSIRYEPFAQYLSIVMN